MWAVEARRRVRGAIIIRWVRVLVPIWRDWKRLLDMVRNFRFFGWRRGLVFPRFLSGVM